MLKPCLVALALLFAASAQAEIYRCETAKGKVEFSDAPCAKGAAASAVNVRANTLSSAESREATLRTENDQLRDKLAAQAAASVPAARTPADAQADLASSPSCKQAKREHEVSASSIKPNKAQLAALASAMRAACGLREPDRIVNKTTVNVDTGPRAVAPAR